MVEAAGACETYVHICQTTRRRIPQDSYFQCAMDYTFIYLLRRGGLTNVTETYHLSYNSMNFGLHKINLLLPVNTTGTLR